MVGMHKRTSLGGSMEGGSRLTMMLRLLCSLACLGLGLNAAEAARNVPERGRTSPRRALEGELFERNSRLFELDGPLEPFQGEMIMRATSSIISDGQYYQPHRWSQHRLETRWTPSSQRLESVPGSGLDLEPRIKLAEQMDLEPYVVSSHLRSPLVASENLFTGLPQLERPRRRRDLERMGQSPQNEENNCGSWSRVHPLRLPHPHPQSRDESKSRSGSENRKPLLTVTPVSSPMHIFSLSFSRDFGERILHNPSKSVVPPLDYSYSPPPTLGTTARIGGRHDEGQGAWALPSIKDADERPFFTFLDPFPSINSSTVVATFEQPGLDRDGLRGLRKGELLDSHGLYRPRHSFSQRLQRQCHRADFIIDESVPSVNGGFGTVFTVLDRHSGQRYALKHIPASRVATNPELVLAEEIIHNELSHPNIVEYYCTMVDPRTGDVCFLLEFVDGFTLTRFVHEVSEARRRIPESQIGQIIAQVMMALQYLHSLNIAHRDVKPDNIMVTEGMQVKLLDFGLASWRGSSTDAGRVEYISVGNYPSGMTIGTPSYLAPEALTCEELADSRSGDLYALGLVAYFLSTGRHYFDPAERGGSQENLFKFRRANQYSEIRGTTSVSLNELLVLLLEHDPSIRIMHVYGCFEAFTKLSIFSKAQWSNVS